MDIVTRKKDKVNKLVNTNNKVINWIYEKFPATRDNKDYLIFTIFLLEFGHIGTPIEHNFLCSLLDKNKAHFISGAFLQNYKRDVDNDLEWSNWNRKERKCRTIIMYEKDFIREEYKVITGENFIYTRLKRETNEAITWKYPEQREIAIYLHTLPTKIFKTSSDKKVNATKLANSKGNRDSYIIPLIKLYTEENPLYKPAKEKQNITPRMFNTSLAMLPKDIRKVLYPDWIDLDIRNCHLSILSGLYPSDGITLFINNSTGIWDELLAFMGLSKEHRGILKEALYSTIYGMDSVMIERNINTKLTEEGLRKKERFADHPLIEGIGNSIERAKENIAANNGINTPLGWIELNERDVSSVLACAIQAYELAIIKPCFDFAMRQRAGKNQDAYITLLQHDGFSIKVLPNKNQNKVIERFSQIVKQKGNEMGMKMVLDVS